MPILAQQSEIYPDDLFSRENLGIETEVGWWAMYTMSRREKHLMRQLVRLEIPFYCPIIPKRNRSPGGRIRTSYCPLFSNYVFLYGDNEQRYEAMTTNCVARYTRVVDGAELTRDLQRIYELIQAGVPLTPESRLVAGDRVRVRNGPFRGYEGCVIRRQGQRRLLVAVNFLQQGASFTLEDCELEPV
jgi:transcription antitermination factor NusG